MRRTYYFFPKLLFGKPTDTVIDRISRAPVPRKVMYMLYKLGMRILIGPHDRYGLPKPDHDLFEAHPTASNTYLDHLVHGRVVAKPGVERLEGRRVYFTDGKKVRAVNLADGSERIVARGYTFRELDLHPGGARMVSTVRSGGVRIRSFDLSSGGSRELAKGCSASFSPDGKLVTNLLSGHDRIGLISPDDGSRRRVLKAPDGLTYDNQFWTNDPNWIAGETEGRQRDIILIHSRTGNVLRVTNVGDATRGDVYIDG